jgi:murein L,D-transpeptidase YafK
MMLKEVAIRLCVFFMLNINTVKTIRVIRFFTLLLVFAGILYSFGGVRGFADDSESAALPKALLHLSPSPGSYVLLVSKIDSRLDVYYRGESGPIKLVKSFKATTGINGGDKQREGDQRTPEGIYYFVRIREADELLDEYGVRAFDMNYPNRLDRINGKDGSGIWLHATDEPERLLEPRSTRGCVVVSNEDITEISNFVTLFKTPIVIAESLEKSPEAELRKRGERVKEFIKGWLEAWSKQNVELYQACYSADFRGGRAGYKSWINQKRSVFEATKWAKIDISDLKILGTGGNYVVGFIQRYRSNLMDDAGLKWVYVTEEDGGLRIVDEEWHHVSRACFGGNWNVKRPILPQVIKDLGEVIIDGQGKLALARPQLTFESFPAAEEKLSATAGATFAVAIEDFEITGSESERVSFRLKLSNVSSEGTKERGWLILVAKWDGRDSFTAFPDLQMSEGRPIAPSQGDSYGIRWFKTVEGRIKKPSSGAKLSEIRGLAYSREGELLLESVLFTDSK